MSGPELPPELRGAYDTPQPDPSARRSGVSTGTRVLAIVIAAAVVLAAAGAGLAAGLGLLGGSDDSRGTDAGGVTAPASPAEPEEGATDAPSEGLAPYYSQSIDWADCGDGSGNLCGTLEVPVDYADPSGDSIEVAVLKVPAPADSRVGSLVVNPGGPGAPGTSYAAAGTNVFRPQLMDAYDLVGFDPRGTGSSDPVDCVSDSELDDFLAMDPDPDTDAEAQASVDALEDFFAGCVQNSDSLVGHVTTVETARDMDVLRAALGESTLDYLGASYGTKLGATYAELFPDRVGRFVLDGAVDVALSSRELSLGQAEGFERALTAYVTDCVENASGCFLGDTVDEGLQRIADFLAETDQNPLPTQDGRTLTEGNAFYGIITPLYVSDYWYLLTQGLQSAFQGDGTTLMLLADAYASRNTDGTYADNSAEAIYAINCLDDPASEPVSAIPGEMSDFLEASPTLGQVFAWGMLGCQGVQVTASEEAPEIDGAGAAPILVVGTTRDPATPYEWAQSLADELESGVLLTRDGDGHTAYNSGNDCIDTTIEDYLIDGVVPDDGTTC
ncbi:alpha/beta hydrolase [Nocardioides bruguierae]|uniref:Alpha/beta hydrolase n=1 Tax=Nocardioides bruguierae TaxID=2945102 RepID=A0A9X2DBQ2_9ACTN|nr:alpha/beta hydrolase [Nocardioides bruguierae]MCM0622669.1 alpha/beta hydrolase [Nocardioides bruguierae]